MLRKQTPKARLWPVLALVALVVILLLLYLR